jgi:hypothetical protein
MHGGSELGMQRKELLFLQSYRSRFVTPFLSCMLSVYKMHSIQPSGGPFGEHLAFHRTGYQINAAGRTPFTITLRTQWAGLHLPPVFPPGHDHPKVYC